MNSISSQKIQEFLRAESRGYIGFYDGIMSNIIPVNFIRRDSRSLYAYTRFRKKLRMLKKNPDLCMEIDLCSPGRWSSLTLWGRYEELVNKSEREIVYKRFLEMGDPGEIMPGLNGGETDGQKISGVISRDGGQIFLVRIEYAKGSEEKGKIKEEERKLTEPTLKRVLQN